MFIFYIANDAKEVGNVVSMATESCNCRNSGVLCKSWLQTQLVGKIGRDEHDIQAVRKGKIQAIMYRRYQTDLGEDGEQIHAVQLWNMNSSLYSAGYSGCYVKKY